jgi:hypothetical protein
MEESLYAGQEMAAEALEKFKLLVSFGVTPARTRPKITNLVGKVLTSKKALKLDHWLQEEDSMDKMELSFEDLEAPDMKEGMSAESSKHSFSPSKAQWNSLVCRVETFTLKLGTAREAIYFLAKVAESRFDTVDGQVTNLRGSIGLRPTGVSPNLPVLNLWENVVQLVDEAAFTHEAKGPAFHALPFRKNDPILSRGLQARGKKASKRRHCQKLSKKKAEYVGQVKPLESVIQDVTDDLYNPEGSYNNNKATMTRIRAGLGESPGMRNQVHALANEVKQLVGSNFGSQGVDMNDPAFSSLKAGVARQLSDNHEIKASLGGETVRIDDEAFHSLEEVKRWVVDFVGLEAGTYEFFFDITLMLDSLQDSGRLSDEAMDSQAMSKKANHRLVSVARMLNSFGVAVPQVMNKKKNPEPFSQVPTNAK